MADITEVINTTDIHPVLDSESQPQPKLSRAEQARINGAKSRGPITPAGKGKSCMNAVKHGRYAKLVPPLEIEDSQAYSDLEALYFERFQPVDIIEQGLVANLASIDWRLARCMAVETRTIDLQLHREMPASGFEAFTLSRLATAVQRIASNSPVLDSLARRESALIRDRQIILDTLIKIRKHDPRPERTPIIPADYYLDSETIPTSNPDGLESEPDSNPNEPAPPVTEPPSDWPLAA